MSSPLRSLALAASLAFALAAPVAQAQPADYSAYYEVKLASPVSEPRSEVQNGAVWNCAGDTCVANKGSSRAAIACAKLVRKLGPVEAFSEAGTAFDAEALARCNGE